MSYDSHATDRRSRQLRFRDTSVFWDKGADTLAFFGERARSGEILDVCMWRGCAWFAWKRPDGLVTLARCGVRRNPSRHAWDWDFTFDADAEHEERHIGMLRRVPSNITRILDRLSPVEELFGDDENAQATAARTRTLVLDVLAARGARPKPKKGDIVHFAKPIRFQGGGQSHVFEWQGGSEFLVPGTHDLYHLRNWRERDFTILASGDDDAPVRADDDLLLG